MATDLAGASDGELATVIARAQAEQVRRAGEAEAQRRARFEQEMGEVKTGQRAAYSEHIAHLSPAETMSLVENGGLRHLGIGKSKRRGER
jgi:hypothetical protein